MFNVASDVSVGSIAHKQIVSCTPDTSLRDAVEKMLGALCSSIVILEEDQPVGIWTEKDALKLDLNDGDVISRPISAFMNKPVKKAHYKTKISEISVRFQQEQIRHLLIVDDKKALMGIVSQSDIIWNQGPESFINLRETRSILRRPLLILPGDLQVREVNRAIQEADTDAAVIRHSQTGEHGIFTERDVVRLITGRNFSQPVERTAKFPLITIAGNSTLIDAKELLVRMQIRHLGVSADDGELIGLLSFADILSSIQYEYVSQMREALEQRDRALEQARKNLLLAHSVIESTLEGIMVTDTGGRIEMINPAFTVVTGYTFDEVIGKNAKVLSSGRHDEVFYRAMWQQINETGTWQGEIWDKRKNGEVYPCWLSINTIHGDNNEVFGYAAIFSDITERKKNEERIKSLAYYDILTELPNRRLFMDRLNIAMANAKRHEHQLGIMFLDLDLFKRINDTLGHNAGDKILQEAAARLLHCIREGDTLARLGGDEFIILLPEIDDESEIAAVARRIIEAFSDTFEIYEQKLNITTSIGISVFPSDGDDEETLLKNADTAMYRVKDLGRNGFEMYSASMNSHSLQRLAMETSMRQALENDEFFLNYQVKVDLTTEKIAGIEGLVRWAHPQMGVVQPMEFIPIAEQNGMILPVGEWVLKEACRQNKYWQKMGLPPTRIAVNLSTHQFCKEGIVEAIEDALDSAGLAPQFLELEVTESSVMQKVERAQRTLRRFRDLGVTVAIDDFGTGFSSLSYLKDLPIDILKIDRSFLVDLERNPKNQAIVSSIIELARRLDIRVIAEGVENYQHIEFLRNEGCNEVQGFLISRPLSPDNIASLFQQQLLPATP